MNCDEAAEFVSALCDGETISSLAAEHIGTCDACRDRLTEYAAMGAELRRVASLEIAETAKPLSLSTPPQQLFRAWWQKGMESMRVPRIAFALLVICVLALGSSLVLVKVGARSEGNVLALTVDLGRGRSSVCYLSPTYKHADGCGAMLTLNSTILSYEIRALAREGDRMEMGFRSKTYPVPISETFTSSDLAGLPQQLVWFVPGETTSVQLDGGITMTLTGEWQDHVPTPAAQGANPSLDPRPNELRIHGPLLLSAQKVIADFEGALATADRPDYGVILYYPHVGRFILSLSPMPGAVRGTVHWNRILFNSSGQSYTLVTGAPVTRADQIWVLYQPDFKPDDLAEHEFSAVWELKDLHLYSQP
ncbi:MAG: anti-sigma factor family protein [Terracidiphilus sp.]